MDEVKGSPKLASRHIKTSETKEMLVKAAEDGHTNARLIRQLLFMARMEGWNKTGADVYQIVRDGVKYHAVCIGYSSAGMDYNPEVYGPVRYVEDLVD